MVFPKFLRKLLSSSPYRATKPLKSLLRSHRTGSCYIRFPLINKTGLEEETRSLQHYPSDCRIDSFRIVLIVHSFPSWKTFDVCWSGFRMVKTLETRNMKVGRQLVKFIFSGMCWAGSWSAHTERRWVNGKRSARRKPKIIKFINADCLVSSFWKANQLSSCSTHYIVKVNLSSAQI